MASATGDRNLLFGILALQMDFIPRDALVKAMHAWVLDKAKPLGQILVEQQALGNERRALLEALVQEHVKQHDDDAGKSLAAVTSVGSVHEELEQITDADVQASLAHIPADHPTAADPYATEPPSVGAPSVVGRRFRILRPHARGGLGEVFVAHDEELHREVALKEIQERLADHPASRARFMVEAEITGGLEHPGIVPVYGLGQYADGRPFYAMRFIKGDSLKDAIQRFHRAASRERKRPEYALELRKLLGRFVDVCDAIGYAHSRGVLHRDLKPGNVMLGKYGETLVVDWGLAKLGGGPAAKDNDAEEPLRLASADDSSPTQIGSAVGTPAFMPPEQAAGRIDQLGPASDVYSLGATLYCLLTGKAPVEARDVGAVLQRVQRGDFPWPRQVQRDVPPALEAVCLKAMAMRPEDRYPTPRTLAADVEKWLADEPVSAWREPWRVRLGRWTRRNQTLVAAVAAGVVVAMLAGGVGALWYQRLAANTERDVTAALEEATALGKQAETLKDDPEKWGAALTVALSAVKRAEGVLNNGEGGDDLRGRVNAVRAHLEAAKKDQQMIARLEEARLRNAVAGTGGVFDNAGAAALYAAAFEEDLHLSTLATGQAADQIDKRAIKEELLAGLDDWAGHTPHKHEMDHSLDILRTADPEPSSFRNSVHRLLQRKDWDALRQLAFGPGAKKVPTASLVSAGTQLADAAAAAEAVRFFKEADDKRPGDFWIVFELAFYSSQTKPPATDEAIRYYTASLMVRPSTSAAAHNNLGNALHDKGRLDDAIAQYHNALQIQPNFAEAHYNLGLALYKKYKLDEHETHTLDESIAEYRKAIQILPKYADAYNNLGNALSRKRQWNDAIAEFRQAMQIQPDDATFPFNAACASARAGCWQGDNPAPPDEKERSRWRDRALDWLRLALVMWTKKIAAGNPEDRAAAADEFKYWREDAALVSVRDKDALAKLPADEQDAWRKLWADVDALRKKAQE